MGANLRTLAMFGVLTGIFIVMGWVVGTYFVGDWVLGTLIFLSISVAINFFSYFYSSKIVLWSYKAKIIEPDAEPRLFRAVQNVCLQADMPMPKIAIVETATPNAFATGRNAKNAVVAATTGLLDILSTDELEGVLAHEMAHIKDKDILVMTIAATLAGAISIAARMLFWSNLSGGGRRDNGGAYLMIIAIITLPIAAMLIRLAVSRNREYKADREGSLIIQRPQSLARALLKLEQANKRRPLDRGNPASASLFIVNPFKGSGGIMSIFMTHPPIQKRVERLEALAKEKGF
jgi:heat shock protein HtpX